MDVVFCESANAKTALFKSLNSLRENEEFLDVTLIIEGTPFKAHKLVLSACSQYFYAMFTGDMVESRQNEITLNGIKAAVFNQILEYFYTSNILLNGLNIQDILEVASYLQADALNQTCLEYLMSQIYIHNCFYIATLAEMYHLTELKSEVYRFMLENLVEFSNSTDFSELTPKQFERIITQDHFVYFSEADFLRLVLSWFFNVYYPSDNFEISDAKLYAERIIKHIRFNEISRKEFDTLLGEFIQNTNSEAEFYKEMLSEAYSNKSLILNPRGMKLAILKIGGVHEIRNYDITFCFPNESNWKYLASIPKSSPYCDDAENSCCPTVLNNELYILKSSFELNVATKYNPRRDEWKWISPMTVKGRFFYSLNPLGNKLYVVGGSIRDKAGNFKQHLQHSERYNPVSNEWHTIKPLPIAVAHHAGAGNDFEGDLKLFISGGIVNGAMSSSMYCYTESTNEWHQCAPMPKARLHHKMISIDNRLYLCGGYLDDCTIARTIDVYDVINDNWELLTDVPTTPRDYETVVCVGRKIYFLGGYALSGNGGYKPTTLMKSYDIDSKFWTVENVNYRQTIAEHDCVALFVPTILAEKDY